MPRVGQSGWCPLVSRLRTHWIDRQGRTALSEQRSCDLATPDPTPVPPLFRLMPINTARRYASTSSEFPAQRHNPRYRDCRQKTELYFDI